MTEYLATWNDGPAKRAVLSFLDVATTQGPGFVEPADRIAAFDDDGTLWVEQPAPPQVDFLSRVWATLAKADPSRADKQPYKAVLEQDREFFSSLVTQDPAAVAALTEAMGATWAGTTPEVFDTQVHQWMQTAKQPRFGVGYAELAYQPMLELFDLLQAHRFRNFICSGGGRDFMRAFAEQIWPVHKEDVIGSAPAYEYKDGRIVRTDRMLGTLSLGPGKPEHLFAQTGRMPVFAVGNADADIEMLSAASFAILVNHDDEDREFAYTAAADKALARADQSGWTVVSMKNDWARLF
jgi:phosphoserine phosphatase